MKAIVTLSLLALVAYGIALVSGAVSGSPVDALIQITHIILIGN